ncbi:MAG: hypothetical protein DRP85_07965 [Candidatus Makaraimicrobium thalassicum]|nr:MAG: hypothetical protein DRP85_07965 [Candidatus Omnitrophota bacterium]
MEILKVARGSDIMADLTITPRNNEGDPLKKEGGVDATLTTPDDSVNGTEFDSGDILTNNTFEAGEMLQLVVTGPISYGTVFLTIHATTD